MIQYFPTITGSLTVNGDLIVTGTGSMSSSNAVSSSYAFTASSATSAYTASSAVNSFNAISSSYSYTASSAVNSFSASKAISSSYSDTASYANNFTVMGNLTVFGTQSVQYITSSQLNVANNVINVNVGTPGVRFGGLSVYDSGSQAGATGSLFWDSQNNNWIYQQVTGSTYTGGMLISGPRNTSGIGNEQGTTSGSLMKGMGGDHITSSAILEDGYKATFYTNSLVVSSSGLVGIGTSAPFSTLHVGTRPGSGTTNPSLSSILTVSNDGQTGIDLGANVNANAVVGQINWVNYLGVGNYNTARIDVYANGNSNSGDLRFWTANIASTPTEKMRITSDGKVGIGTTNPGMPLELYVADGSGLRFKNSGSADKRWDLAVSGNDLRINETGVGATISFKAAGNVGIGTTNPAQSLEVNGNILASSTGKIGFRYSSTDGSYYSYLRSATAGSIGPIVLAGGFESGGASNEAIRFVTNANPGERSAVSILNSGKVGIGTTGPTTQFQIRKNYWQFWDEKAHGSNVNMFSITFPDFGSAVITVAGSRYSPGADNYSGTSIFYIYITNVGAVSVNGGSTSGTWTPTTSVASKTVTFASAYAGSSTNYSDYSVVIQASGHSGGSESAVYVTIL